MHHEVMHCKKFYCTLFPKDTRDFYLVEKIVLNPKEEAYSADQTDVKLWYPLALSTYVLVHII